MSIRAVYLEEKKKLAEVFKDIDDTKRNLVDGLIDDAAFLKAENQDLKSKLMETGTVTFHPQDNRKSKANEAAKQYLKNINSYSVVIKTLNGILTKNIIDEEDDELEDEYA